MDQSRLEKLSLLTAILGLTILFIVSAGIIPSLPAEPPPTTQDQTTLSGTITRIAQSEKAIFLTIDAQRHEQTSVVIFSDQPLALKTGDHIEITGQPQLRNGRQELIASTIKLK